MLPSTPDINCKLLSYISCLILISFSHTGYSQAFISSKFDQHGGTFSYQIEPDSEDLDGSPYLGDWEGATIYFGGNQATLEKMNYNFLHDEFIFYDQNTRFVLPKEKVDSVKYGSKLFTKVIDSKNEIKYMERLAGNDRFALLTHYRGSIIKGTPSKGYIEATPDQVVSKEVHFVYMPPKPPVQVRPGKGHKIFKTFNDSEAGVAKVILADYQLELKSLEDLITFTNVFSNSIE